VLLVHEHHLKSIGSDMRLLGLLLQLRGLGHSVSFLFRGPVPLAQRSPPTQELAALIGASETDAQRLSQEVPPRPPPAIYEHSDLAALAALARHGWFDLIFCTFWFWRDPAPSSAELFLPTLAMHAPIKRRPWIMILSDDAHSAKATMMSEWEKDPERQRLWTAKAASLPARQQAVYSLADGVVYISDADLRLERSTFNASCAQWFTLRMSPRGFGRTTDANATAAAADGAALPGTGAGAAGGGGLSIGFMGDGATPTNHLSVQWFIEEVWPALLERKPELRLRLVGYPPDDRPKREQKEPCNLKTSAVRCGWAWGTPYAGDEEAAGIDALGFLSDADMLAEMRSWRAMVVPILRTTGVNTKLLPALQYSVPLVLTSVAASPLGIPLDGSVALVADDAPRFLAHLTALLDEPALQRRLSAASGRHWRHLLREDAGATDLLPILAASCAGMAATPRVRRPTPRPTTPPKAPLAVELAAARRRATPSRCFPAGAAGAAGAPALYVALHGGSAHEGAALLLHVLLASLCAHCELRCVHARGPPSAAQREWDVLIEHESTARPVAIAAAMRVAAAALAPRPLLLLHAPSAPLAAALRFSARGGTFASLVQSELLRAQLRGALQAAALPDAARAELMLENINNNSRVALLAGWRGVLQALGVAAPEEAHLAALAEQLRSRFGAADPAPQWQGCFRDSKEDRLFAEGPRAFGHTSQACAAACTGHRFFALQGGGQCFCGRTLGRHGRANHSKLPDAKCGQVCPAEEGKEPPRFCGAGWRNAVYAESRAAAAAAELLQPPPPPPPPPSPRRTRAKKANASTASSSHHARSKHHSHSTSRGHRKHKSTSGHHLHTSTSGDHLHTSTSSTSTTTSRKKRKHTASKSSKSGSSRGVAVGTLRH